MKTAITIIGAIFGAIGALVTFSYAVIAVIHGPRKTWKHMKDAFQFGCNYEF